MNVAEKLAALVNKHRSANAQGIHAKIRRGKRRIDYQQARAEHYKYSQGHHPCEARGTATKNTRPNHWNARPTKANRLAGSPGVLHPRRSGRILPLPPAHSLAIFSP
jgi:hypothetical protein